MRIALITDDNAGFPKKEIERLGLYIVPMPININGVDKFENKDITHEEFFKCQEDDCSIHTSQPMPKDVLNAWDLALKEYDEVVYIPMSSGLSESTKTAKMLALSEDKYKGKVYVVDNRRISVTLRCSIYDAYYLANNGKNGKEIKEYLEQTSAESSIYIMVDTLKYLLKGGRVTPAGAALGAVFHIKPILKIEGGKLDAKAKAIGAKKATNLMISYILEDIQNKLKYDKKSLSFGMAYTKDLDKALQLRKEFASSLGIKEEMIMLDPLSLSIATHIGAGSLAVTVTKVLDLDNILKGIK